MFTSAHYNQFYICSSHDPSFCVVFNWFRWVICLHLCIPTELHSIHLINYWSKHFLNGPFKILSSGLLFGCYFEMKINTPSLVISSLMVTATIKYSRNIFMIHRKLLLESKSTIIQTEVFSKLLKSLANVGSVSRTVLQQKHH